MPSCCRAILTDIFRKESVVLSSLTMRPPRYCEYKGSQWTPKSVLVTGGCGFIGSNFINRMFAKWPEANWINLDKLSLGDDSIDNVEAVVQNSCRYSFVRGDYQNDSLLTELLKKCPVDLVINFAAESNVDVSFAQPFVTLANNVGGLISFLETCRKYGKLTKFIHISTDEVYGDSDCSKTESDPFNPTNPYAVTKVIAEQLIDACRLEFNFPATTVRMNNVFGPRQNLSKVTPKFTDQIANGQPVTLQGDGTQLRSWMHVNDATDGIQLVVERGATGEVYNLGTDDECSIVALAEKIYLNIAQLTRTQLVPLTFRQIPDRPYNDRRYLINSTKARKQLGWFPETPFEDGLKSTVSWYIDEMRKRKFGTD